ncbi:hypothetical protein BANT918_01983 [Brevibacterium antiquum CNRZ 918]|uniref:Uncharacterized protein n=1 Tax=Brevibacterium antiquum CNRZ 918 TaxID=1255637 RepID=A0A2H1JZY5_9MICO|nr:hypothetical protein BANT918_01983 [Brevibacterium antiquum CNRZ 918]
MRRRDRLHSQHQLLGGEGLREVVVGTGFEAVDAVLGRGQCGEHEHGNRGEDPQPAAHLDAIDAGQLPVENDEIRHCLGQCCEGPEPVGDLIDEETGGSQIAAGHLGDRGIVFD